MLHEATEVRKVLQNIVQDALHDPLTGLVNRREFERQFQCTLERLQQASGLSATLFFLDLDNFKAVNVMPPAITRRLWR